MNVYHTNIPSNRFLLQICVNELCKCLCNYITTMLTAISTGVSAFSNIILRIRRYFECQSAYFLGTNVTQKQKIYLHWYLNFVWYVSLDPCAHQIMIWMNNTKKIRSNHW